MPTNTAAMQSAPQISFTTKIAAAFKIWFAVRSRCRAEIALRSLGAHALKDIGIHRTEISSVIHGDPRERIRSARFS